MPKDEALERLGFSDTNTIDEANEAPFSSAMLPNGWSIIWSNDFKFAASPEIRAASRGAKMICCHAEEHVMYSASICFSESEAVWSVIHDAQTDLYNLQLSGDVPAQWPDIEARLREQQDSNGGRAAGVDYIFDAPLQLAESITGYRHDRWQFPWGEPQFTVIERRA